MTSIEAGERQLFGKHWTWVGELPQKEAAVAAYPRRHADGNDAEVTCHACPARFYGVRIIEHGSGKLLSVIGMGSGMAKLAADIAEAVSDGMLTVETL